MVIPTSNPGILKHDGRTEMRAWLKVDRGIYLGSGRTVKKTMTERCDVG